MPRRQEIDGIDRAILRILRQNARTKASEIARELDKHPNVVRERITALCNNQAFGIIEKFTISISEECSIFDKGFAYLLIQMSDSDLKKERDIEALVYSNSQILYCDHTYGGLDFIMYVGLKSDECLPRIRTNIMKIDPKAAVETYGRMKPVKEYHLDPVDIIARSKK